jgi:hypothetical protein
MRCPFCCRPFNSLHDPAIARKLDDILAALESMESNIMAKLDDIIADVADESTVDDSIITLLNNIAQQLKDAGQDPAKLQALQDAIDANKAKIAAAVAANTPAG